MTPQMTRAQEGFSLLETVMALSLLLVVSLGLLPLGIIATTTTENQGHLMARTTEYAQDKMEQLWRCPTAIRRRIPACFRQRHRRDGAHHWRQLESGCAGRAVRGLPRHRRLIDSLVRDDGTSDWFYKRVWQISSPSANLKQLTVTARVKRRSERWMGPRSPPSPS